MKLPENKASDLISKSIQAKKESKRTTFKLSDNCIQNLDWMMDTFGFTTKEVFDLITEDQEFYQEIILSKKESDDEENTSKKRKTFVISKQALNKLNKSSEDHDLTRDTIVEALILAYKKAMEHLLENEEENEKQVLETVADLKIKAEDAEISASKKLSKQNPILHRLSTIVVIIENLQSDIEAKLSDGTSIDPNDL